MFIHPRLDQGTWSWSGSINRSVFRSFIVSSKSTSNWPRPGTISNCTQLCCLYWWNPYHGLYTNFDYRSLSTTGFLIVQIAFAEQPLAASDVQYFWMRLRTYGYMKCFIFLSTANKIKSRLVYSSLYSVLHFWLLWHWCIPQTSFHSLKLKVVWQWDCSQPRPNDVKVYELRLAYGFQQ